jgi:hypothetical protein
MGGLFIQNKDISKPGNTSLNSQINQGTARQQSLALAVNLAHFMELICVLHILNADSGYLEIGCNRTLVNFVALRVTILDF